MYRAHVTAVVFSASSLAASAVAGITGTVPPGQELPPSPTAAMT